MDGAEGRAILFGVQRGAFRNEVFASESSISFCNVAASASFFCATANSRACRAVAAACA